jgi:LysM repeat protein
VVVALVSGLFVVLPLLQSVDFSRELVGPEVVRADIDQIVSLPRPGLVQLEVTEDIFYKVDEGETLSEIAAQFDLETRALAEHNDLSDPDSLMPGQTLRIPPRSL